MADDRTIRDAADRSRINMQEDYEVRYWTSRDAVSHLGWTASSAFTPRRAGRRLQALGDAVASTSLASFLFAVALVRADSSFLLTAVLPVAPTVLAAVHPVGLSDGERAIG